MRGIMPWAIAAVIATSLVSWHRETPAGGAWVQFTGVIETETALDVHCSVTLTEPVIRTLIPNEVVRVVAVSTSVGGDNVSLQRNLDVRGVTPDSSDILGAGVGPVNLADIPVFAAQALGMDPQGGTVDMSLAYTLQLQPADGLTWGDVSTREELVVTLQPEG